MNGEQEHQESNLIDYALTRNMGPDPWANLGYG